MPSDASSPVIASRWPVVVVGIAVVWCVYARTVGVFTDFWFDEVWSWSRALSLASPWDTFTKLHHDNNHYLNTLWIYALGDRVEWPVYRIPAVLTGIGTVLLLARIGFRWGEVQGLTSGLLGATSYLFLLYSTEARGYGPALFFAVACVDLIDDAKDAPSVTRVVLFNTSAMLGFLSHASFLFPYAGLVAWSTAAEVRRRRSNTVALRDAVKWHAVPVALFAALYVVDLRALKYGGGTALSPWSMAIEADCYSLGLPHGGWWSVVAVVFSVIAAVVTFVELTRQGNERRWFYVVGSFLAPAVVIAVTRPEFFFPRYFLLCVPGFILMLGECFAIVWRLRLGRAAVPLVIGVICAGNALVSVEFMRDGRGHFLDAFTEMAHSTAGHEVTVGSNWELHLNLMSAYYVRQVDSDKSFEVVPRDHWSSQSPEWLVWEYYDPAKVEPAIQVETGAHYRLRKDYPFSARLSGAGWWLYQRVPSG